MALSFEAFGQVEIADPVPLLPLEGTTQLYAFDINDAGMAVGYAHSGRSWEPIDLTPAVWDNSGVPMALPVPIECGISALAQLINNKGDIFGLCYPNRSTAVFWGHDGTIVTTAPLPGDSELLFNGMNNRAVVAGYSAPGTVAQSTAVLWSPDFGFEVLAPLPGDLVALASDVNNKGTAIGRSGWLFFNYNNFMKPVRWDQFGNPTQLGLPAGPNPCNNALPEAINNNDVATGACFSQSSGFDAVRWEKDGSASLLERPPGTIGSDSEDINDRGQIAGTAVTNLISNDGANVYRYAVIWDRNNNMIRLPIPADRPVRESSEATDINNSGQVLGYFGNVFFQTPVVWTVHSNQ